MGNYKLYSFDKIDSTQNFAHELVATGRATNRTIVLADAQSAGRGRYRRTWVSHHGNLYASFIFSSSRRDPRLAYATAVAVADTLISFGIRPEIKWPNDILADGKKISGVLIDYARDFVIIGIGINIKANPTIKDYPTAKTDDFAPGLSRDAVLTVLKDKMDAWMSHDFAVVRTRWMELAAHLNTTIVHRGAPATLCGINDDGALVLRRGTEYLIVFGDEISAVRMAYPNQTASA